MVGERKTGCYLRYLQVFKGGFRSNNMNPKEVFIFNEAGLDGLFNVYHDVNEYILIQKQLTLKLDNSDRLLVGLNPHDTKPAPFHRSKPPGMHTLRRIIQDACISVGVFGTGEKQGIVTRSLRGTVATILIDAGRSDITMLTGYRQVESLKSYQIYKVDKG